MRNYSLYIAIFSLLSLLLLSALVLPRYKDVISLKQEILEKEFELESQEQYFQTAQEVFDRLKRNEASLLKIESALPANPALPELLSFIQKAASQSGLTFKRISPALVTLAGAVKKTKVNFVLVGSYPDFKNFISAVEISARLIEVESVHFSYPPKGGPFTFDITIMVHSY